MRNKRTTTRSRKRLAPFVLALAMLAATAPTAAQAQRDLAPRQRLDFNDGWRFHLGDPDGDSALYLYDVRPEIGQSADGKVADAMSEEAARIVDKDGVEAPRAAQRVRFAVDGPGELAATDNGDPTSFTSFQSPERAAFNGLVLGIVRARPGVGGTIRVRIETEGLQPASLTLRAAP